MFHRGERVAVISSAQTQLRPAWREYQHVDLISEAVSKCLKGTGLTMEDVDFVIDSGSDVLDGRSISNCGFLGAMGAHLKEESRVEEDGLWSALYAATKIASGSGSVGLVVAYSKPSEGSLSAFYATQCEPFLQRPVGFGHEAASGLQAQSYLAHSGTSEEVLAEVVAAEWAKAAEQGTVEVDAAPSAQDVLASRSVATPLRELQFSRPVDGAVAILLANKEVADRVTTTPVWISGIGTAMDQHAFARRERSALPACEAAAKMAYKRAGIQDPTELSLAEVTGTTVTNQLMVLEALGLAAKGQGASLYDGEAKIAINPSGGSLPADPVMATGLVRMAEASRQLTGLVAHAPAGAQSAVVHGAGGIGMQNHCVFTLEV